MDKRALSMMDRIMDGIEQTEEWTELQLHDPGIQAADRRLDRALEAAKKQIPPKVYMDLSDAHSEVVAAYCDAAILYGMRVAAVIQAAAANPSEMTRFWLERAKEATA